MINTSDQAYERMGDALMIYGNCVSAGCYARTDADVEAIDTVADAALLCREPRAIARNIVFPAGCLPDMEQGCGKARSLIGIAPAVALVDAGPLAPREVVGVYLSQVRT